MSQKSNRPELLQRIEALIDNLTAINDKAASICSGWPMAGSLIRKAGRAGNGRTASVCSDCFAISS